MTIIRGMEEIEAGLAALARIDPRLLPVIEAAGPVPLRLAEPGFAGLAQIVVSQMVSRASASAVWARIEGLGIAITPADYRALSLEQALGCGLSRAKAATLASLAEATHRGEIDLLAVRELPAAQAIAALTALKGIGPWTAEVYLMFCGGHADIFPVGDVALRAAVGHAFAIDPRPDQRRVAALAEAWAPWRSVAARLFWAYYAKMMRRDALPLG